MLGSAGAPAHQVARKRHAWLLLLAPCVPALICTPLEPKRSAFPFVHTVLTTLLLLQLFEPRVLPLALLPALPHASPRLPILRLEVDPWTTVSVGVLHSQGNEPLGLSASRTCQVGSRPPAVLPSYLLLWRVLVPRYAPSPAPASPATATAAAFCLQLCLPAAPAPAPSSPPSAAIPLPPTSPPIPAVSSACSAVPAGSTGTASQPRAC